MDCITCYSPIAFDMGATHTGIFSFTKTREVMTPKDRHFCTIVLPPDSKPLKYSMQARTAKRHQVRGYKRFKLARRMLFAIIRARFKAAGIVLEDAEQKKLDAALSGLLKRRGYNRVEVEADISSLDPVDPQIFSNILPEFFSEFTNLRSQWTALSQDMRKVESLKNAVSQLDKSAFKSMALDKDEAKAADEALKALKLAAQAAVNMTVMGHKHRKDYLTAIEKEIDHDTRLAPAIKALGSKKKLLNLVGNISNLQERAGRWYFDGKEKAGLYFNPASLKSSLIRAFKFFHPESDRRQAFGRLIRTLRDSDDIVETLCEIDPLETIPPYEDQNNRRPPLDMTLLLNPAALTKQYGDKWHIWVQKLLRKEPFMEDDLDVILVSNDRTSAKPIKREDGTWGVRDEYKPISKRDSYALQRFLDRSKASDPYALRLICRHAKSSEALDALQRLTDALGSQHVETFLGMAARYYSETESAKNGLWEKDAESLLERSNLHPSTIGHSLDHLLSGILGQEVTAAGFTESVWKQRVGRSTVCGICRKLEETRKVYGNGFKIELARALSSKDHGLKLDETQKSLVRIAELVGPTADFIGEKLGIPEAKRTRFANAFSLAQLYTLIEGDQNGYTSTCRAVHEENLWRMKTDVCMNQEGAICSRLPADCVRPFDGVLRRILDRCAWEAAKIKAAEIRASGIKNATIDVICIAEQNRFAYSASLAEIKNQGGSKLHKAQKSAKDAGEKAETRWTAKRDRIKADGMGICPYTGEPVGDHGEYDHILSRSYSKAAAGTVFNSEINLIYCTQKGNDKKKEARYYLSDLSPKYLKRIFGTSDVNAVSQAIEAKVAGIAQKSGRIFIEMLDDSERQALRHALFLEDDSPARMRAFDMMNARLSTIVNGTQGWFLKAFQKKLRKELASWCEETGCTLAFEARQMKADDGSALRSELALLVPESKKEDLQSAASHCIDALCAYAVATADPRLERILSGLHSVDLLKPEILKTWLPERCEVVRADQRPLFRKEDAGSRPLYKDTIYGERFLPVIEFKGSVWVGFGLPKSGEKNSRKALQATGKNPGELIRLLTPFFKPCQGDPALAPVAHIIDKVKAFDFLWAMSKKTGTDEEKSQAALLCALHYETCKVNVEASLRDASGKAIVDPTKWKKPTALTINVKQPPALKKQFSFAGELRLPAADQWDRLFEALGKAADADGQFEVLKNFFKPGSDRSHAGVRRVFSLPIVKTASGGFRIRRKGLDGEPVYQLQAINDRFTSGFELNAKGRIDWKKPSILPMYATRNLTPLEEDQKYRDVDYASADRWEIIGQAEGVTIEMCPATKPRPSFRITQPAESFFKTYEAATGIPVTSILQIAPDPKISKDADKRFKDTFPAELRDLVSLPRTALNVLSLANQVRYMYKARDSYSAEQKKAYEKAIAEKSI